MLMAINVAVFIAQFLSKDRLLLWGAKVRSPPLNYATFIGHSSYRWIGLTCSGEEWHEQLGYVRHCSAIVHTRFCCSNLRVFMPFHVGAGQATASCAGEPCQSDSYWCAHRTTS